MKSKKVTKVLLSLIVVCIVVLCLVRFFMVYNYLEASPDEITQWFPRFGPIWLLIRNWFSSTALYILFAIAAAITILHFVKLSVAFSDLLITVFGISLYTVVWIAYPLNLLAGIALSLGAVILFFVLKYKYPIKFSRITEAFRTHIVKYQNHALAAVSILFTLTVVEIFLRHVGLNDSYSELNGSGEYNSPYNSSGERGWYHLRSPNDTGGYSQCTEYAYHFSTNSEGLVDKERTVKKTGKRIMCLGDSFTEGMGATGDSTLEHFLEWQNDSLEVMNCGIAASDPFFEYKLFEDRLLKYAPDQLFVFINESDISDVMARGGFERFNSDSTTHFKSAPWWEGIYAKSYITRLIVHNGAGLNFLFLTPHRNIDATKLAVKELDGCLDRFQSLCMGKGIKCVFVFQAGFNDFKIGITQCDAIKEYAINRHYAVVDLFDYFKKNGVNEKNVQNFYWPVDRHNKNKGYALIAKALKSSL